MRGKFIPVIFDDLPALVPVPSTAPLGANTPPGPLSSETEVLSSESEVLAWLVILSGGPVGEHFRLGQTTTIGRDPGCAIQLDDTAASGKHADVKIEDGRFFVYDCNSTNGVFVHIPARDRWQKVERHELKDGTRFKLGRTVFHLMALAIDDR